MERDLNNTQMESISLKDGTDENSMKDHGTVPIMGGNAIENPMAPAFPHAGLNSIENNSHPPHPNQREVEVSYGSRPNSLPESHLKSATHSFSVPNNLSSAAMSPTSPVTSPRSADGAPVHRPSNSKIDTLKSWSISTYKCTKQLISEKLGKSTKTIDSDLEVQIDALRDTQRKYSQILRLARALSSHFYHVVQTQQQLGDAFADLSQKSPELQEEFIYNAQTQRTLTKNGETLLAALNFFVNSVNTLCNKTMEDTLLTIKNYEQARIEFDAYRTELEAITQMPRAEVSSIKLDEAQRMFQSQKATYEQLKADVSIKLKFLEENKVKVMHKQLLLFHNAISAYFTGNQTGLETTLKQFNIKAMSPDTSRTSWLEQTLPETFGSIFRPQAPPVPPN